jgi:hypothetical protein
MTELQPVTGMYHTRPYDINDSGEILGGSDGYSVVWRNGGIEILSGPGCTGCGGGTAINNHDQIIGGAVTGSNPSEYVYFAILWHRSARYILNLLVAPGTPFQIEAGIDINDVGQILCRRSDVPGLSASILLTPINCDVDDDGDVELNDFEHLTECMAGPSGAIGTGCMAADFDGDGDVDFVDHRSFELAFEP